MPSESKLVGSFIISYTPYRLYVDWLAWIILYFFPYVADMAHDDVVIAGIGFLPDNIINLFLAEHSAWIVG